MPAQSQIPARMPGRHIVGQHGMGVLLVANGAASGAGASQRVEAARSALRAAGARVEVSVTLEPGELPALWTEAAGRRIVLLGGDGTLHAAANVPGPPPELALVPAGRANNVARSLGIPLDATEAARLAVEGRVRPIDLIRCELPGGVERHRAVEGVSAGLHAIARARYSAPNSADLVAGARAALGGLIRFSPREMEIDLDGDLVRERLSQVFVANMPRFAFGLRVAPDARPDDGLLDVVILREMGRIAAIPATARMLRGDHVGRDARMVRARRVTLDPMGASPVIADTLSLGEGPVTLQAEERALPVVRP